MDFNSLGENSPIYIIRKKPFQFVTGKLKSKSTKQPLQYVPATQQNIDLVISVNGNDEIVPNVPQHLDAVQYGNAYYCLTPEATLQAVSSLMQVSQSVLAETEYHQSVLTEGEKVVEQLNPQYAEGKRQARTIRDLQARADEQDKKLDKILSRLDEVFSHPKK